MKKQNFDEIIDRRGTDCEKYDMLESRFQNANAIPLWVADTDFRVPNFITEAIHNRANHEIYGYSYRPDGYYDSIINWMSLRHQWKIDKKMIIPTSGIVATLSALIMAFTEKGDRIIIQPPVYTPFFSCVKDCEREIVENPLQLINGRFTMDLGDLLNKINKSTKLLILCNPHNPVGRVWTIDELKSLSEICLRKGVLIISDEIHSDLIYKNFKHTPFPTISEKAANNCIVCMAPSKTFNIAGLASSFVIIPDKDIRLKFNHFLEILHLQDGNLFGNIALEAAYREGYEWIDQLMVYLQDNRDWLCEYVERYLPKAVVFIPEATYLCWIDFRNYNIEERKLNRLIIDKAGVVLTKGSIYGVQGTGFFRLNFGTPRAVLQKALGQIAECLGNIS